MKIKEIHCRIEIQNLPATGDNFLITHQRDFHWKEKKEKMEKFLENFFFIYCIIIYSLFHFMNRSTCCILLLYSISLIRRIVGKIFLCENQQMSKFRSKRKETNKKGTEKKWK